MKSKKRFSTVLALISISLSIVATNCFASSVLAHGFSRNLHRLISTQSKFKFPVTVSERAWREMENRLGETGKDSFSLAVSSGGCSGFKYELKPIDSNKDWFS